MTSSPHLAAVPDQPGRAVLYVRVSAVMGRGGDTFHSPDVQLGAMRRFLTTAGLREVGTVEDIDQTGRHFSREGIDKIRHLVEARKVDAIAVYDISRLGRNVLESLQFLRWLADRGVTVVSACEHIDTSTPAGEAMLINLLTIAQLRSREIGRGWRDTISARAREGRHHGRPPAGYRRGDDGRLEPDPVYGPPVAHLFTGYADGVALKELRRRLHAATGQTMATSTVKHMLRNETYRGIIRVRSGARVEAAHEPLVDDVTWERVQRRLAEARREPPRLQSPAWSLSGLARCARCRHRATVRRDARRGDAYVYCGDSQETTGDRCPGCGAAPLAGLERAILAEIRRYVGELRGDVGAQAAREARAARAGADADTLERELAETKRAMVRLTERWARGGDDHVYEATMERLRDAEQQLGDRLDQVREVATGLTPETAVQLGDRLVELWDEMTAGERSRALRELIEDVVIHPSAYYRQPPSERIEIIWR